MRSMRQGGRGRPVLAWGAEEGVQRERGRPYGHALPIAACARSGALADAVPPRAVPQLVLGGFRRMQAVRTTAAHVPPVGRPGGGD